MHSDNNSLSSFEYCPICGTHSFRPIDNKAMGCSNCGLRYYANVATAVALFVVDEKSDKILVAERGREPAKGTLDLPGGFVDPMETVEDAVRRELFEETGLNAKEIKYLFSYPNIYRYSGIDIHTSDLFFLCKVENLSKAKANDDVAGITEVRISELKSSVFGLESIRSVIGKIERGEISII